MKFPEAYRIQKPFPSQAGDPYGCFLIPGRAANGRPLRVIANAGEELSEGWDHVSISLHQTAKITPSWAEMCAVKSLFWDDETPVAQYHPPASEHISFHHGCLHLWHHPEHLKASTMPPARLVGPPKQEPEAPHVWP